MRYLGVPMMLIVGLLLLSVMTGSVWAEVSAEVSPEVASLNLTPEQWVGHNFLILDLPADKRSEGYELFAQDQYMRGFQGDRAFFLPYAGHVGQQVTVTEVAGYTAEDERLEYVVYFTENSTGEKLVGRTIGGQLEGLVLEADLQKARQHFLGRTVYVKRRVLQGAYDPGTNKAVPLAVVTKIGDAAQVVDVYAGIQAREPIWLIVMVNGQKAILPIAYSWTNMPVFAWTQNPPWQNELFAAEPRATLGWSEAVWTQIETGVIQEGMTKEQVRLSWGPPVFPEESAACPDKAIWHYGTRVLCFTGDSLTSIETVDRKDAVIP